MRLLVAARFSSEGSPEGQEGLRTHVCPASHLHREDQVWPLLTPMGSPHTHFAFIRLRCQVCVHEWGLDEISHGPHRIRELHFPCRSMLGKHSGPLPHTSSPPRCLAPGREGQTESGWLGEQAPAGARGPPEGLQPALREPLCGACAQGWAGAAALWVQKVGPHMPVPHPTSQSWPCGRLSTTARSQRSAGPGGTVASRDHTASC